MKKAYIPPKIGQELTVIDMECWCDICFCKRWINKPGVSCIRCIEGIHKKSTRR